jgi:HPt (histidine-containing phosphotransfer) domain-containing protein
MSTLDASILEELRALGGHEALRETIALFKSGVDKNLLALREQQDDYRALVRAAHSLRGSCAVIGARRMAELGAQLEELARACTREGIAELIVELESEYGLTRIALDAEERRSAG